MESMLPRESNSKETDAAVFSVIGFPAFAVNDDRGDPRYSQGEARGRPLRAMGAQGL